MRRSFLAIAAVFALASPALASGHSPAPGKTVSPAVDAWIVTVGVRVRVLPEWEGSQDYRALPLPIFGLRRAGTPERFSAPDDGIGFALVDTGFFRAGPVGRVRGGREDDGRLRGLGDVGFSGELGGFAEVWPLEWLRLRGELRYGFGGYEDVVGDLKADVVWNAGPWTFNVGPRAAFNGSEYAQTWFGVTPAQSAASVAGLPVYAPGGGFRSVGATLGIGYRWNDSWRTSAFIEYDRLIGDAADSPLVRVLGTRDQLVFGLGASYSFVWGR